MGAIPIVNGSQFRAWVGNARNPTVREDGFLYELRKSCDQGQSTKVILLEQDADAANIPCSEPLPNEFNNDKDGYAAADMLRPVYEESDGRAGFVSFALPQQTADDVRGVAGAARRMWYRARRPNVLIQIPATPAAIKALFRLIAEAVSVHVTHIASQDVYRRVAESYIAGLRHRAECGLPVRGIASFATLPESGGERAADAYGEMFSEIAFGDLRRLGARSQILVLIRSDDGHASDGALGAIASSPSEQA
jgi:hypothetical protein